MVVALVDEGESVPFTFLKTAVAPVEHNQHRSTANILLDEGAQKSFISSLLAAALFLQLTGREALRLSGFVSSDDRVRLYDVTKFTIIDRKGEPITINAVIVDHIVNPLEDLYREAVSRLPHLYGLSLAHPPSNNNHFEVDVLIGADFYWTIVNDTIIRGKGPTAVSSRLGFLVSGPMICTVATVGPASASLVVMPVESFNLTRFWEVESMGPQFNDEEEDEAAVYQQTGLKFAGDHYIASFPWKENHPELLSNYNVCEKRTRAMIRRLFLSPDSFKRYDDIIKSQLERKFIEKVIGPAAGGSHYIPHFAVEKLESRTTPVRSVFDCSCKTRTGVCLNDCLCAGPPLQNNMIDILLHFSIWKYGIAFDVEKAFHKIELKEEDRDFVRFLWLSDSNDPMSAFEVLRFRVLPFGANCSPFILNCVVQLLLSQSPSDISRDILSNIYVDNLSSGCDESTAALDYYKTANSLFAAAGLDLKVWGSSAPELEEKAQLDGVIDSSVDTNILGVT